MAKHAGTVTGQGGLTSPLSLAHSALQLCHIPSAPSRSARPQPRSPGVAQGPLLSFGVTSPITSKPAPLLEFHWSKGFPSPPGSVGLWVSHSGLDLPYLRWCKNLVLPVVAESRSDSRREELTGAGRARNGAGSVQQEHLPRVPLLLCGTAQPHTEQTLTVPT